MTTARAIRIAGYPELLTPWWRYNASLYAQPACPSNALPEEERAAGLLPGRVQHEDRAGAFIKADERVKSWSKAPLEERMIIGRWLVVTRVLAEIVRVEITEIDAPELEDPKLK